MISSEEIGKKLRDLRKSKKLTTTELANRINVSQSYISQFELGKAVPNIILLQRILNALGTDISTFFALELHESIDMIHIIEIVKSLNPDVREKLHEFLQAIAR